MYQDIYNEIYHHGIKGMKWGVRRFQNADGSLTAAGKARYGTKEERRAAKKQLKEEKKKAKKLDRQISDDEETFYEEYANKYVTNAMKKQQALEKDLGLTNTAYMTGRQIQDLYDKARVDARLAVVRKYGESVVNQYDKRQTKKFVRNSVLVGAGETALLLLLYARPSDRF